MDLYDLYAKEEVSGARSMGIYVIKRDIMIKLLEQVLPKANDFRSEVIQGAISMGMKVRILSVFLQLNFLSRFLCPFTFTVKHSNFFFIIHVLL